MAKIQNVALVYETKPKGTVYYFNLPEDKSGIFIESKNLNQSAKASYQRASTSYQRAMTSYLRASASY